jgi:hypothetical protein
MSRVGDMPVYEQLNVEVPAKLYNLWRRAKLHLIFPIRFSLEGFRGLVMILDQHEWLCADETMNDLPVICWLNFDDKGRDAIHLPVACTLNYYHFAASKIQTQVLELMEKELEHMLGHHE